MQAASSIDLGLSANDVDVFTAQATAGSVTFADQDALTIGQVVTLFPYSGVFAGNGNVVLTTTDGDLSIQDTNAATDVSSNFAVTLSRAATSGSFTSPAGRA